MNILYLHILYIYRHMCVIYIRIGTERERERERETSCRIKIINSISPRGQEGPKTKIVGFLGFCEPCNHHQPHSRALTQPYSTSEKNIMARMKPATKN